MGVNNLVVQRKPGETKAMLLEGEGAAAGDRSTGEDQKHGLDAVGLWKCVRVSPGVDLHMSCDLPKPKPAALRKLVADLEAAVRRNL
jgi:hypothetical protein